MKTAVMKLEEIQPAAYNPRVELKPGDPEFESLGNSLDKFGLAVPLIVNERTGVLISGHQRLNVLKAQGIPEAEVILVDLDESQEKLLNVAMNKIDGDWDYIKLRELFDDITAEGMDDLKYTGFSESELQNLYESFDDEISEEADQKESRGDEPKERDEAPGDQDEEPEREFTIYLSFPTKEAAEGWLKGKGIETEYKGTARNITVKMEGIEYGTGNQN